MRPERNIPAMHVIYRRRPRWYIWLMRRRLDILLMLGAAIIAFFLGWRTLWSSRPMFELDSRAASVKTRLDRPGR